ncbi:MAG: hypothetical protein QM731_21330 [Chitinophagaceae bacterium]
MLRNMLFVIITGAIIATSCNANTGFVAIPQSAALATDTLLPNTSKVIHVFVALCDNKNQGIVPVPAGIGNGQHAASNLYWGCAGGVKGFLKRKASAWKLVKTIKDPAVNILERCVFKHKTSNAWLVADAYDGATIKQCTIDFFTAAAGGNNRLVQVDSSRIGTGGSASLVAYIGHDGLMDFSLDTYPAQQNKALRETIILACISKRYFSNGIRKAGASPLLWSTGLMSPEAYTLEAAVEGWLLQERPQQIRMRAANAYHQYQHCGVKAASNLLVTGW